MASKKFAIDSIDFRIIKLVPESDIAESKNHILLPFLYEDEDLLTQAAVSATTTTTINSRNDVNTNNTVNNTNSILMQSNTTTAINSMTGNKNINNNTE